MPRMAIPPSLSRSHTSALTCDLERPCDTIGPNCAGARVRQNAAVVRAALDAAPLAPWKCGSLRIIITRRSERVGGRRPRPSVDEVAEGRADDEDDDADVDAPEQPRPRRRRPAEDRVVGVQRRRAPAHGAPRQRHGDLGRLDELLPYPLERLHVFWRCAARGGAEQ